jgi:hypothetical protein
MASIERPDSILIHPALAGRTLVVRHGGQWAAFDIHAGGRLSEPRQIGSDPTLDTWRGGVST